MGSVGNAPFTPVILNDPGVNDSRVDASEAEKRRAETVLDQEVENQIPPDRNYRVTADRIRQLRTALWNNTRLSERQINEVLRNYFTSGNGALFPGHDSAGVQAALREETLAGTNADSQPDQPGTGREASRDTPDTFGTTDGNRLDRMARGDVRRDPPPTTQPRVAVTPPPPAPPPPPPQGGTPRTPTKTAVATGTPEDAPAPEGTPPPLRGQPRTPDGQPVVATTGTGLPVAADGTAVSEAPQPDVHLYCDGEKPRPGAPGHDQVQSGLKAQADFRMLCSRTPQSAAPMPTPQGGGEGATIAQILRRPSSDSAGSKRDLGLGYSRGGGAGALLHRGSARDRYGGGTGGFC